MISRRMAIAAAAGASLAGPARAQTAWPDRPLRVIVPFAAGGNADTIARILQPRLQDRLGQPVVVENRPGAGGSLGAETVARSRPDGYTLLIGSNGPLSVNPAVQARLPYDAERDFAPVAMAMQVPHCLMVQSAAPWRSVADVVAASRARPDALGAGTAGVASATHLSLEAFKAASGAQILHVPYRGGGAAVPDFVAGNVPLLFTEFSTALPLHRDGKGRIVAVASAARLAALREVPTMIEQGIAGFTAASYVGLVAPAGTPAEVLQKLGAAMAAIVADPDFRARMEAMGGEAAAGPLATPEGFAAFIREDLARSRSVVRTAGITMQ
ncbi:tripartite tricarboxylate transporter substrate binding protein [Roseomonas alkaliterrae]|uniref:Tripartite-type tricarboxylate transporter receptor subunit TctC n=1 Tax=Neoroseomonas alkaliterrae TaxID=1452450 RepID=A0A840Y0F8_9PROT|nr:tripartite tricarboxylate transporter substrate-binding protein [Neoroseomonas alkaliterrae]MBB5689897.1 tripartite-type tricarboxylate transporter receptor subunit TctC [Neoroseomonas alkaliterrae]MBR0675062.1 tripartite tricarboxylate transporter substrate binding protein [Neoroseomonas alkaliterrae]